MYWHWKHTRVNIPVALNNITKNLIFWNWAHKELIGILLERDTLSESGKIEWGIFFETCFSITDSCLVSFLFYSAHILVLNFLNLMENIFWKKTGWPHSDQVKIPCVFNFFPAFSISLKIWHLFYYPAHRYNYQYYSLNYDHKCKNVIPLMCWLPKSKRL